jgi:mannosylglucosylglycerate synthase
LRAVPSAVIVSFRLGGTDGVAVEARKWAWALGELGFDVRTVAGEGTPDELVAGLGMDEHQPPDPAAVRRALERADLVVVENLCSLPLNRPGAEAVAAACAGRPCILHHHDLPWQRPHLADRPGPPDDPAWRHVTINDLSRRQLAQRGIGATLIYNAFDLDPPAGARDATRGCLGIAPHERLVLQPTRAIERKNVAGGLVVAEALGATFWLLGPPEDGFAPELERLMAGASTRVVLGPGPTEAATRIADAYAASDVVVLPSTWEGFGNPAIEAVAYRRPLAIGRYPVAEELVALGFEWFWTDETERLATWLADPDDALFAHDLDVARRWCALEDLPTRLSDVLRDLGLG